MSLGSTAVYQCELLLLLLINTFIFINSYEWKKASGPRLSSTCGIKTQAGFADAGQNWPGLISTLETMAPLCMLGMT